MFTAQELAQKKVYFKQLSSEVSQVPQPTLLSSQLENLTTHVSTFSTFSLCTKKYSFRQSKTKDMSREY